MKRIASILPLVLLAHIATAQVADDAAIRKILADRIDVQRQGVGIVVGVIEPEGRRIVSYGHTVKGGERRVDGDTVFEIGSITKVFTSLLLADMIGRGEVALTDPVTKYLPAGVKAPAVTLEQLATHTSGLPRLPSNLSMKDPSNPYADYTVAQLHAALADPLTHAAGSKYDYSNLAAGLLGHVLSLRAKKDYETLVRERILDPLAMQSSGITLTKSMQERLAAGYDENLAPAHNWDLPTLAGAGALRSTVNDMLAFLAASLGYTKTPLAKPMAAMLAARRPTGSPNTDIALGWHITTNGDREIVWHNGGTGGYRTWMGYDPKRRTGVVVLSNTSTNAGIDDIGRHLLDSSLPLIASRAQVAIDPKKLDRYVGVYELTPDFKLTVTREGDRLFTQASGQPKFEVFPESERKFFLKVVDAQLVFEGEGDGLAPGVVLHQGGRAMPARRVADAPPPPKEHKEITVDPKTFDAYIGRYQLAPNFILTVTREDDKLFVQATGQPKFQVFPEAPHEFFYKVVDAQLTFVVDEKGRATSVILHQNAADVPAKRME